MISYVLQAQKKDPEAYAELIRSCEGMLYKVARTYLSNREDIADAIQEAILLGWEKLPSLKEPQFFKTWLVRILIRECYKITRKRPPVTELEAVGEQAAENADPLSPILFRDMLDCLEEPYQIVFLLYYGDMFSVKEIAGILDVSEDAVKQRLLRGRKELRKRYEEI